MKFISYIILILSFVTLNWALTIWPYPSRNLTIKVNETFNVVLSRSLDSNWELTSVPRIAQFVRVMVRKTIHAEEQDFLFKSLTVGNQLIEFFQKYNNSLIGYHQLNLTVVSNDSPTTTITTTVTNTPNPTPDYSIQAIINTQYTIGMAHNGWILDGYPQHSILIKNYTVNLPVFPNSTVHYYQHFEFLAKNISTEVIKFKRYNFTSASNEVSFVQVNIIKETLTTTTTITTKTNTPTPTSSPTPPADVKMIYKNQEVKEKEKFFITLPREYSTNWTMISKPQYANMTQMYVVVGDDFINGIAYYSQMFNFEALKSGQEKIIFFETKNGTIITAAELNLKVLSNVTTNNDNNQNTYDNNPSSTDTNYSNSDIIADYDNNTTSIGSEPNSAIINSLNCVMSIFLIMIINL